MLEFPDIQEVYEDYDSLGFRVLAVNPIDDLETILQVRENPEMGITFQLLMDNPIQNVHSMYNIGIYYPQNFFIDGSGKIRYRFGITSEDALRSYLNEIYSGP
jgi:thiol-disulfide isomerase/thioredoxin